MKMTKETKEEIYKALRNVPHDECHIFYEMMNSIEESDNTANAALLGIISLSPYYIYFDKDIEFTSVWHGILDVLASGVMITFGVCIGIFLLLFPSLLYYDFVFCKVKEKSKFIKGIVLCAPFIVNGFLILWDKGVLW